LEVAIVATGEEEFARYVAMVPHLVVVVGKGPFTVAHVSSRLRTLPLVRP